MPVRIGEAFWEGNFLNGKGTMNSKLGNFDLPYSVHTRFENNPGSNPEELIGAAHAGCFSMALSKNLTDSGFEPESIHTRCRINIEKNSDEFSITHITLLTEVKAANISNDQFQAIAQKTMMTCPVSRALKVPMSLEATLFYK